MEDDPDTDYVDEYGRTRTAPRSQVPRQHLLKPGENIDADEYDNLFHTLSPSD